MIINSRYNCNLSKSSAGLHTGFGAGEGQIEIAKMLGGQCDIDM